jgi:hypothetical protein
MPRKGGDLLSATGSGKTPGQARANARSNLISMASRLGYDIPKKLRPTYIPYATSQKHLNVIVEARFRKPQ